MTTRKKFVWPKGLGAEKSKPIARVICPSTLHKGRTGLMTLQVPLKQRMGSHPPHIEKPRKVLI